MAINNSGRYGEDLSRPPDQRSGESREAYLLRLKEWQRKRSMSGSKAGTRKKESQPEPKKKESAGGWMGKVTRALGGGK